MLREVSENAWNFAEADQADLSADEIIIVGIGEDAKAKATELTTRGIAATRMSYVDLAKGDDFYARIGKPKHMFWDDVVCIDDFECEADFPVWESGIAFLDKNFQWGWRQSELMVMCGPYGCGKSTFSQFLAMNYVNGMGKEFGSGALLCSWEDMGEEVKRNVQVFADARKIPDLGKRIHFVRRKSSAERLVSWFFDLVRYHRRRYGTRYYVLDPWNEMDHKRPPNVMETDYVKDILREFRDIVDQEQIICEIATHVPGKYIRGDGSIEPFKSGNAFGSSNFGNKVDRGICIARTKAFEESRGHTVIRLDKAKVERKMGRRGTVAAWFDEDRFDFVYDGPATLECKGIWKD